MSQFRMLRPRHDKVRSRPDVMARPPSRPTWCQVSIVRSAANVAAVPASMIESTPRTTHKAEACTPWARRERRATACSSAESRCQSGSGAHKGSRRKVCGVAASYPTRDQPGIIGWSISRAWPRSDSIVVDALLASPARTASTAANCAVSWRVELPAVFAAGPDRQMSAHVNTDDWQQAPRLNAPALVSVKGGKASCSVFSTRASLAGKFCARARDSSASTRRLSASILLVWATLQSRGHTRGLSGNAEPRKNGLSDSVLSDSVLRKKSSRGRV